MLISYMLIIVYDFLVLVCSRQCSKLTIEVNKCLLRLTDIPYMLSQGIAVLGLKRVSKFIEAQTKEIN